MAQHYEVSEGKTLIIKGPANIIVKTGDVPLVGDAGDLPPPPVETPTPAITAIDPATAEVGGVDVIVSVSGTGFIDTSVVNLAGAPLATVYTDATILTATISPVAAIAGVQPVTVTNDALASNAVDFTFTDPVSGRKRR
jgi:hypothetical protein